MNRVLLVLALPLVFSVVARAQQPAMTTANALQGPNPPNAETPVNALLKFINDLRQGNEISLSLDVVGAPVGYYGTNEWNTILQELPTLKAFWALKIQDIRVENQTPDEATVVLSSSEEGLLGDPDTVTFRLRRGDAGPINFTGNAAKVWRIVPLPVDEVLARPLLQTQPLQLAAVFATRDPRLLPLIQGRGGLAQLSQQDQGLNQLKQLALGAFQFVQDYNEIYAFDDAAHERALLPYLKNSSLYTIAGTKGEKWRFNDNLATLPLAQLNEVARTVLFYDGEAPSSDKLNFRFDGKTLVGFADGHCKALAKDEMQDLIWKP